YSEVHGIEEGGPSTGSGTLAVYPNPTDGMLIVQTLRATSLHDDTYRITNLMGQTVLSGNITAETQQIDVLALPEGMYFITVGETTLKFVIR
ncbi:MAG: T9SS type A sorting domain-containing protein, partial [Bacteroidales bacterium]|nr:T9SS type A sorting domain-containing protein [Bacteroidales bacterium]